MSRFDYASYFQRIRELERLVVAPEEVTWTETYKRPEKETDVLLYLGCNVLITPHLAREVIAVFQALGIRFEAVGGPQFCCGIVHHGQGDVEAGRRLAAASVAKLESYGAPLVVMWCPSCNLHFDEVVLKEVAPGFGPAVTHATRFLADRAKELPFRVPVRRRAVVHTHIGRAQQESDAAACRELLAVVPGLELVGSVSSPDLGYHCATPTSESARRAFMQVRGRLLNEARSLGADTLITIYHSCQREWCEAEEPDLEIRNYISLVAESLGCGADDRYKRLRNEPELDRAVAGSAERWSGYGWDAKRAEEVIQRHLRPSGSQATDNG
ncbi:MAG TPA: heterodisulfide reductase-related iron-sulfur binding cluster [Candidatus Acidoferrales bacterium]|nr:heterodisulfide reductase-related iron-sulfur binding cluster [Candidatus Acidoferrales bacterium]